ncbi:MAG: pyridoxamine 5'-phosphate oxidase family protein [Cyanobacteria bacterium P01_A01_bin.17]
MPSFDCPDQKRQVKRGNHLDSATQQLINQADTLFVATTYTTDEDRPSLGADASHRGGKPGFVHVEDDRTFILPDFSGNLFYNTVGNILLTAKAGFLFIDFETNDLVYLTGRAEVISEGERLKAFVGAERLIRFHTEEWLRVADSLPLRFRFGEYSPSLQRTGSWEQVEETLAATQEQNVYAPTSKSDVGLSGDS